MRAPLSPAGQVRYVSRTSASRRAPRKLDHLERIDGREIRRTGWTTTARRCPRHDLPLELCFDETDLSRWSRGHQAPFNHDDDRVRWRCAACVGAWTESFFLEGRRRTPAPVPLVLSCPSCASHRVTHGCEPGCCGLHVCVDCGAQLDAVVDLITPGDRFPVERLPERALVAFGAGGPPPPESRSGWSREFRRCPDDDRSLELVFIALLDEAPTVLGWYCSRCMRSWSESSFRHLRTWFAPDARPATPCPTCGNWHPTLLPDQPGLAECLECGCRLRITLVLRPT